MNSSNNRQSNRKVEPGVVFGCALVILLLINAQDMFNPPYWDALTGLFTQALWLKEHNLNLAALAQQPGWAEGGANTNVFLLLALFNAALLSILPNWAVFFVGHALNLFCAALTITLFYKILCAQLNQSIAVLWCLAAALDPIWIGQTASLYVEIPQGAAYAASIYFFQKKNYLLASLFCVVASLAKQSALILAIALIAWLLLRLVAGHLKGKGSSKSLAYLVAPLPIILTMTLVAGRPIESPSWSAAQSLHNLWFMVPWQTAMVLINVAVLLWQIFSKRARRTLVTDEHRLHLLSLLSILVIGFWASFYIYYLSLCRYTTAYAFPAFTMLALLLKNSSRRQQAVIAFVWVLLNGLNLHGNLMLSLPDPIARSGEHLERSREYLSDLRSNLKVCRYLDAHIDTETPLVVKYPFTHMVLFPELGYTHVHRQQVLGIGLLPHNSSLLDFSDKAAQDPTTVYIYSPNVFEAANPPSLLPVSGDEILFTDWTNGAPAIVFRRKHWSQDAPLQ